MKLDNETQKDIISNDLDKIIREYPEEIFLVGPGSDDYQFLADLYWGNKVKEFVSIQDYELVIKNESILYKKTFMPVPNIRDRRQIWISGGISKNENDDTDYSSIKYLINFGDKLDTSNFEKINTYQRLTLWKKIR